MAADHEEIPDHPVQYSVLRSLRKQFHLTQTEMANIIGVSTQMISVYEHGKSVISPEVLGKYSEYFNVSMDLFEGHESHSLFRLHDPCL